MERYGIVIIGAGSAGYVGAIRAAQLGARVCLVECAELGGVCLNWGCIPTKTILTSARFLSRCRRSGTLGIEIESNPKINLERIRERRDRIIRIQRGGVENLLKSHGVTLLRGRGRLVDPETVAVSLTDGGETAITGEKIILATGSRPRPIPGIPFDGDVVLSSDHAVALEGVPEELLIVGAGSVGSEFAFIYSGLGSKVTLVEMLERALPLEDSDVSEVVGREMRKWGIEFIPGVRVETLTRTDGRARAVLSDGKELEVDKVLVSIGRAYNTEDLNLEAVSIELNTDRSLKVDEGLETTCRNIYAAGDCIGGRLLAHVASEEAIAAVQNCLGMPGSIDYSVIPSCTFTVPEVGSVGMTEEEARGKGIEVQIGRFDLRILGKAHADDEITGMVKIIADSKTDRILGAHVVGHEASCLIHEIAVAMKAGVQAKSLGETVHAHPTLSEAIMEAAADVHGLSIHKPRVHK
jgi:dihydrolipoamide dehydrogenase